jgi:hypothetical protein
MTIRLLPVLLVLGALPAVAQPAPKQAPPPEWPIPVVAAWSVGDSRYIEVIRGKREFKDGALTRADSSTAIHRILVTEAGEDYYRVRWFFEGHASSQDLPEFSLDERLVLRAHEEGYSVLTDERGAFQRIENRALLYRLMHATVDGLLQAWTSEGDPEAAASTRGLFERLGGVDHLVDQLFDPVEIYYDLYGYEWNVGGHGPFADSLDFGSRTVPVTQTVKVSDLDKWGTFTLTTHLVADAISLRDAMGDVLSIFQEAVGQTETTWEEEVGDGPLSMREVTRYLVDAVEGWVLELDSLRVLEVGETSNQRYLRMRLFYD